MEDFAAIAKVFFPGSVAFLFAGLAAAVLFAIVAPRYRRVVRGAVLALVAAYVVISLPWTAKRLLKPLSRYESLAHPEQLAQGGASSAGTDLFVFHGDHEAGRLQETLRLYHLLRPRRVVVVARGPQMRDRLRDAGIPRDQLIWAHGSVTTREQALETQMLVRQLGSARVVLVASPIQMRRALAACEAAGVHPMPVPAVSPLPYGELPYGVLSLVPRRDAYVLSADSLYEYAALGWYHAMGWA